MTRPRVADKLRLAGAPALSGTDALPIHLPRLLFAIHEQRPDLAARFDLTEPDGVAAYVSWCLTEGRAEYRCVTDLARTGAFSGLDDPDPGCSIHDPTPVTGLMRLAWRVREDVQDAFPLPKAAEPFVWWFFLHGARELGLEDLVGPRGRTDLTRPLLPADGPDCPPLTKLMVHLWRIRPDLQSTFDLREPEARCRFGRWFLTIGAHEHDLEWLFVPDQIAWLKGTWPGAVELRLTDALAKLWLRDPDLRRRFDLSDRKGVAAFVRWGAAARREPAVSGDQGAASSGVGDMLEGVDLVGYARGELGIGEDVRMLARALSTVDVPNAAIDVRPHPAILCKDTSLEDRLIDRPWHRAVVFAMTGMETVRVVGTRGFSEFRDRYVIGHWPWELPAWPRRWEAAYDLVDEIWTVSRYNQRAFIDRAPVPVLVMPPPVELPSDYRRWRRVDFGLPESAFLFHFSFDFLSYPHRKNPEACIKAFRHAFPRLSEAVGLVVKSMRSEQRKADWRRLREAGGNDPRIIFIDGTMSRSKTIGLMSSVDAYVSLHRAEGFGRGLAEAMLLGRPVIATDHSGNKDFLTEETGFPVEHRMVAVRAGRYPGGEGQHWADPSVEHAAVQMRRVFDDYETTASRVKAGKRLASRLFSPQAAGARYRDRLEALGLLDGGR